VPTDGEALDRRDPQLLDRIVLGRDAGLGEATVELVNEAEVPPDVEEVRDLPLIKVREVDPRAEEPSPGVLRVLHRAAA